MQTRIICQEEKQLDKGFMRPITPCKLPHVGGWAVLYFYGEPWVPVLKNINWNGSSSGSTHKWNGESRFQVQFFPQKREKKDDDFSSCSSSENQTWVQSGFG
jgi:hypothetical protein